jgi:homoserine O-acetyltransferase/O-succinyltransferase
MLFPKFDIGDVVQSQYRLLKEKFGIDHLVAVVGPRWVECRCCNGA